ncbi:helix-turn-helix domain-containing protein [Blastochloris tepida]|uniref:helix-turn-helix domain-containing protein n=1 Tax=Blastochloris tepida TaxID=2233851 RepID=UPI000F818E1C|nr:helix-turn-helix domain-containing protein [Blastochloris tepida]
MVNDPAVAEYRAPVAKPDKRPAGAAARAAAQPAEARRSPVPASEALGRFALAPAEGQPSDTFRDWRAGLAPVFDVAATPAEIAAFAGGLAAWSSGRFVLTTCRATRLHLIRSPETVGRSPVDHVAIRLIAAGSLRGSAGASDVAAEAGDILFLDLLQSLTLQLGAQDATEDITLWVPRARFVAALSDEHLLHGQALRAGTPAGAVIGAALAALVRQADAMTRAEMDALAAGISELTARVLAPVLAAAGPAGGAEPLASFLTIRRYIDRNLAAPTLDPDAVARAFGLSRASLYRLFEPIGGVACYIRRQRLNRAYQEITAPSLREQRIGPIAHRWGFRNLSAFNRLFAQTFGLTPGDARAAAGRCREGLLTLADEPAGKGILAQWLEQTARA